MMAATNSARSLSSSSRELNFIANWNLGSIISLNGRRKLFRNSLVMKPLPYATSRPSLFMHDANMAKSASWTPYFNNVTCWRTDCIQCLYNVHIWRSGWQIIFMKLKQFTGCGALTWSFKSRFEKPGTDLANSVSSVTVSTEVHWQQWNIRTSASLFSSPPEEPTILATKVCSANCSVSMSWITKGYKTMRMKHRDQIKNKLYSSLCQGGKWALYNCNQ